MKNQTIKVFLNLVTPTQGTGCDECLVSHVSGMQCPVNDKGELLCDVPKVWQSTHWKDNTSLTLEINLSK